MNYNKSKQISKKVRKPSFLKHGQLYAGFEKTEYAINYVVYVAGRDRLDISSIELNAEEVHRLAAWMSKASAYLRSREDKK